MAREQQFDLTLLEAEILVAINHVGWYAYLWFPIVYRDVLNFGYDAPDEEVYTAFCSLIQKKALTVTQARWGAIPEWSPAPAALAQAISMR